MIGSIISLSCDNRVFLLVPLVQKEVRGKPLGEPAHGIKRTLGIIFHLAIITDGKLLDAIFQAIDGCMMKILDALIEY